MKLEKARQTLGKTGENMTDKEVLELVAFLDHMTDIAIESFEKKVFGKPLKTLLTNYETKS